MIMSLRRFQASATTPLIIENTMTGATRTSPTIPNARAFRDGAARSETCQRIAGFCMSDPVIETNRPIHSKRKFRCCRATNVRRAINVYDIPREGACPVPGEDVAATKFPLLDRRGVCAIKKMVPFLAGADG